MMPANKVEPEVKRRPSDSMCMVRFRLPITRMPMNGPVVASDGQPYERVATETRIEQRGAEALSPLTGILLNNSDLTPNIALRQEIQEQPQRERRRLEELEEMLKKKDLLLKEQQEQQEQSSERERNLREELQAIQKQRASEKAALEQQAKQSSERQAAQEQTIQQLRAAQHSAQKGNTGGVAAAPLPLPLAAAWGQMEATEQQLLELKKQQSVNRIKRGLIHRSLNRLLNSSRLEENKEQQTHALVQAQHALSTAQGQLETALRQHDTAHAAEVENHRKHHEEKITAALKKKDYKQLGPLGLEAEKQEIELKQTATQRRLKIEAESREGRAKTEGELKRLQEQLQNLKVAKADKQRQVFRRAERVSQLSGRLHAQAHAHDELMAQQQRQPEVLAAFFASQQEVNKYKQPLVHYKGNRTRLREKVEAEKKAALAQLQKELIAACKINDVDRVRALIDQGANTNYFDPDVPAGSPNHHPLRAALYCFGKDTVDLIISRADERTLKLCARIGKNGHFPHVLKFILNGCTHTEFYRRYNEAGGGDLFDGAGHVKCKRLGVWLPNAGHAVDRSLGASGVSTALDDIFSAVQQQNNETGSCERRLKGVGHKTWSTLMVDVKNCAIYLRDAADPRSNERPSKRARC